MLSRHQEAEERYQEALPIFRQIGDRQGEAKTLVSWGRLRRTEKAWADAVANFNEAERIFRLIELPARADVALKEAAEVEQELLAAGPRRAPERCGSCSPDPRDSWFKEFT